MRNTKIPAFPMFEAGSYTEDVDGMSLRDYFAAKVITCVIHDWRKAYKEVGEVLAENGTPEEYYCIAAEAYSIADAMLKARNA